MRLERVAQLLEAFVHFPALLSHFWRRGTSIEYGPGVLERQGGAERDARGGDCDGESSVSAAPGVCLVLRMIKCKSFWSPIISKQ